MYIRIREKQANRITQGNMIFSFELIGVEREMRILHCDNDPSVISMYIFYPDEKVTKYPTSPDVGGIHVHIELWKKKRLSNRAIILDPDTAKNTPVPPGTKFYLFGYDKLPNTLNNLPVFKRKADQNYDNLHTQPEDPYQG